MIVFCLSEPFNFSKAISSIRACLSTFGSIDNILLPQTSTKTTFLRQITMNNEQWKGVTTIYQFVDNPLFSIICGVSGGNLTKYNLHQNSSGMFATKKGKETVCHQRQTNWTKAWVDLNDWTTYSAHVWMFQDEGAIGEWANNNNKKVLMSSKSPLQPTRDWLPPKKENQKLTRFS